MKRLIAILLLVSSLVSAENFTVEKLTTAEVRDVVAARKELKKAETALRNVENRVKKAHGDSSTTMKNSFGTATLLFCQSSYDLTSVELRGVYALITVTTHDGPCSSPAIMLNNMVVF